MSCNLSNKVCTGRSCQERENKDNAFLGLSAKDQRLSIRKGVFSTERDMHHIKTNVNQMIKNQEAFNKKIERIISSYALTITFLLGAALAYFVFSLLRDPSISEAIANFINSLAM